MTLTKILEVADAVLYEGYLLYPYRSTSSKNQSRWQFGVLGPPGAATDGIGEEPDMHCECLIRASGEAVLTVHLRFLQLQSRILEQVDLDAPGGFVPVDQLVAGVKTFTAWDEATEKSIEVGPIALSDLGEQIAVPISVDGGDEVEVVELEGATIGRVTRRRWPLRGEVGLGAASAAPGVFRLSIDVRNTAAPASTRHEATRESLLGAHVILEAEAAGFVSLLEPPDELVGVAKSCENRRCWPVLAGEEGSDDALLISPIILYDYPEVAPESAGSLFDSTEIDEILTLRVMTLTDEEKAEARATDPAAARIIDRCDAMTPEELQRLHGALRDPRHVARGLEGADDLLEFGTPSESSLFDTPFARAPWTVDDDIPSFVTPPDGDAELPGSSSAPWWDPGVDARFSPSTDEVVVNGVAISKGSAVLLHPSRSADAQDLFFVDEPATVAAIFADVDGQCHVAVVLDNDPAADLHQWYGRYLYFSPEEVEPLGERRSVAQSGDGAADNNDKEE